MIWMPDLFYKDWLSSKNLYVVKLICRKSLWISKLDFSTVKSKPARLPLAEEHALFGVSLI